MKASKIAQFSATGDVITRSSNLRSVVLTAGSDAATATVKAGGSSGTTILTIKAATATTVPSGDLHDALCSGGIYVTLAGTGPVVTFVYT